MSTKKKQLYIPKGACQFFWTGGPKGTGCVRSNCKYKHGKASNEKSIQWNPRRKKSRKNVQCIPIITIPKKTKTDLLLEKIVYKNEPPICYYSKKNMTTDF